MGRNNKRKGKQPAPAPDLDDIEEAPIEEEAAAPQGNDNQDGIPGLQSEVNYPNTRHAAFQKQMDDMETRMKAQMADQAKQQDARAKAQAEELKNQVQEVGEELQQMMISNVLKS